MGGETVNKKLESELEAHPFLKGLSDRHRSILAECSSEVRFKGGDFLTREGESADTFYLLREGRASIEIHAPDRGGLPLQTLEAGEVLGWSWIVPPHRWNFDARALSPITAIGVDCRCLRGKFEADHELAYELMKRFIIVMSRRLEATRFQLLDLYAPEH